MSAEKFPGVHFCVVLPFCNGSFLSCSLILHYKISKYQCFSSNFFQVKLLCSGERFLINSGMYWANFTLPLRRPQKGCFSAISCPRTAGWSLVPRLLKIGFFFANLHLNYSPTTGSEVAWAEPPVERSVHGLSLHVVPGWGSSTSCPFTRDLGQAFCVKEAGNGLRCVFCFCCAPLCIHEKPRYDTWTHCAKVRQRDTSCSSVTVCSFSLLGKLEVVSAFMSTCCHTGGQTKDAHAVCLFLSSPHTSALSHLCGLILSSGVWCQVLEAQSVFEKV